MKYSRQSGLSLVEVLISTVIIAVAIYGTLLALTVQQAAEARQRDYKVLRQLHYQLVREILKNEHDASNANAFNSTVNPLTAVALGRGTPAQLTHTVTTAGSVYNGNYGIKSDLTLMRIVPPSAIPTAYLTSTITVVLPYDGGVLSRWKWATQNVVP